MAAAAAHTMDQSHIPVLITPLIRAVSPVEGLWLDGTLGAGGYTRALLEAGADHVIGLDRDPQAHAMAAGWIGECGGRVSLVRDTFSNLDAHAPRPLDGVVLDLGVSSMQIDEAERGFSFQKDGPLDMRMGQEGESAAEIVNTRDEAELANILWLYGEERASRRIARAIVAARPLRTTLELATLVSSQLPRPKPGQSHPATRTFQALRIAVNDEYGELREGLMAAERALAPGGHLAVVTFHSVEDRMVKRFMAIRSGRRGGGNRHAPESEAIEPGFEMVTRKAVEADAEELAANPRSRSARLRVARRTEAEARPVTPAELAMPRMKRGR